MDITSHVSTDLILKQSFHIFSLHLSLHLYRDSKLSKGCKLGKCCCNCRVWDYIFIGAFFDNPSNIIFAAVHPAGHLTSVSLSVHSPSFPYTLLSRTVLLFPLSSAHPPSYDLHLFPFMQVHRGYLFSGKHSFPVAVLSTSSPPPSPFTPHLLSFSPLLHFPSFSSSFQFPLLK